MSWLRRHEGYPLIDHSAAPGTDGGLGVARLELATRVIALVVVLVCMTTTTVAAQQRFTPADTLEAIEQASANSGVPASRLRRIIRCETGGTYNPYARGRAGELGAAQLHPRGELRRFYAVGYTNPYNPYDAAHFLADRILAGGARAWTCK